jgi:hypothetical protein
MNPKVSICIHGRIIEPRASSVFTFDSKIASRYSVISRMTRHGFPAANT